MSVVVEAPRASKQEKKLCGRACLSIQLNMSGGGDEGGGGGDEGGGQAVEGGADGGGEEVAPDGAGVATGNMDTGGGS